MEFLPQNPQSVIGYNDYLDSSDGDHSPRGTVLSMMQPQNKKEKKLTQKQLKNREKNLAKQNKKMNKQMDIQLI